MIPIGQDSLHTRSTLAVGDRSYTYFSLAKAAEALGDISRLPFSMKVLLENLLRFEDGVTVTRDDLQCMVDWQKERSIAREIQYRPARVLSAFRCGRTLPCRDSMPASGASMLKRCSLTSDKPCGRAAKSRLQKLLQAKLGAPILASACPRSASPPSLSLAAPNSVTAGPMERRMFPST